MEDLFFNKEEFLTVSELNQLIRDVLNMGFSNAVWVCGEIQGFNRSKDKRHVFFELCEKDSDSKDIVARIGLVIFAGRKKAINDILASAENAFQLKDDIEVKFLCRVDFYPPHGAIRLVVESIDPIYTLGKIAQEKQKLIALLKEKGVLEKNKALSVSRVPLRIGLITSFDSAAYNDFVSELKLSHNAFKVFFRNALMQGKAAEKDVCAALRDLIQIGNLDVIVITRGGGSIADLSCFDSKAIAENIARSPIPVFCGIGHEINITVTDLAAHTYQKTPTAIARLLVEKVSIFLADINERGLSIIKYSRQKIENEKQDLKDSVLNLQTLTNAFLKIHHQFLSRFSDSIIIMPDKYIFREKDVLVNLKERLSRNAVYRIKETRTALNAFQRIIDIADPRHTLRRGFSITRQADGRVLKSIEKAADKEMIVTQLFDGQLYSEIRKINKEEKCGGHKIQ